MKLDRLCLLLQIVAGLLQIASFRRPLLITEFVLLLFLIQFTRWLRAASFVKTRAVSASPDPHALATPEA